MQLPPGLAEDIEVFCQTWGQLHSIYERDLKHKKLFLTHPKNPAIGTDVHVELTLPSDTTLNFNGKVKSIDNDSDGNTSVNGFTLDLIKIPQTTLWLLESSLQSKLSQKEIQQKSKNQSAKHNIDSVALIENAAELKAAENDLVQALWTELSALSGLSPWEVLQCDKEASSEEIRRSFGKLTKKYHPDRFKKFRSDELELLASELFMAIRDAYKKCGQQTNPSNLSKSKQPPPLIKNDVQTNGVKTSKHVSSHEQPPAPSHNVSGVDTLLKKGDYKNAREKLKAASTKSPEEKKIQSMIEYTKGMESKASGDKMEFVQKMEEALSLDPDNKPAAFEIAQIRRKAVEERKALLAKLMKKDKK